ncbi:hypothetical protein DPMN_185967 [Dreissena polymorpha]|uniref:Uncharacterized protein n=1 Tax=Dreissena polymorpha TaxID=45954 RepID=A0A9D4DMH8_DREPO|nr:hypothetical protein DPMN_185967 [Dreissena polymorpha]
MGSCIVEIDRIVIREVQYQFAVNRCRNEEIIVKGNFGWLWSMWAGHPRVGNKAMHIKGNFVWVWSMWVGRPRVGNGAMHKVQYQFEAIFGRRGLCGPGAPGLVMGHAIVEIDRIVIREFQGCSANSVGGDSGQDGQTDRGRR